MNGRSLPSATKMSIQKPSQLFLRERPANPSIPDPFLADDVWLLRKDPGGVEPPFYLARSFLPILLWSAANLNWSNFLIGNLVPVTIGNIIGGSIMVVAVYWFIYLRKKLS